jgi:putative serine protease PepD
MGDMVTGPLPYEPPEPSTGPSPLPGPSGPQRPQNRTAIAAAALLVIGAIGGGALGAEAILSRTPAPTPAAITRSTSTSAAAQAQTPSSATAIYQQASPGVVTISTQVGGRFGRSGEGTGSGIVLNTNGDILTNAHVVAGANTIQITFKDGRTLPATLVNSNTSADLAVVRVSAAASSLHPLTLGNSDTVQVGDQVYAIGAPFGLPESMTAGIVSGLNRHNAASGLSGLIQTDAPINPGNSGGALLNTQGQVIGVNDSIESPIAGNVGIGFAIPINVVKQMLSSLEGAPNQ